MNMSAFAQWEAKHKMRQLRENVKNIKPTSQTPNRAHPKLGLDNTPPYRHPFQGRKTATHYMTRKKQQVDNRLLAQKILQIMHQPRADADYSVEFLPGLRVDKEGNTRVDCHLNMTKPKGGMLPGTGLGTFPAPSLQPRIDRERRIARDIAKLAMEINTVSAAYPLSGLQKEWDDLQKHCVFYKRRRQRDQKIAREKIATAHQIQNQRAKSAPGRARSERVKSPAREALAQRLRDEFGFDAGSKAYAFEQPRWID